MDLNSASATVTPESYLAFIKVGLFIDKRSDNVHFISLLERLRKFKLPAYSNT